MPTPLPAGFQLIIDLSVRYQEGPISEVELANYSKQARDAKKTDPALGLCALGMIAAIKGNEREMRDYHERAITVSGEGVVYIFNYGSSLEIMGFRTEAFSWILRAVKADPGNLQFLNRMIWTAYTLNDNRLETFLGRWKKLRGEPHPVAEEIEDERDVAAALASIETEGTISWEDLRQEMQ
ncbi:MAG: hypothetical protein PWQ57_3284 [Desulfovibrionales bacterium]|nr:hypothetical protein [Desulfovibrionales bacterium]